VTYCGSCNQPDTQFLDAVDVTVDHARGWSSALFPAKEPKPDSTSGGGRMPIELKRAPVRLALRPQDLQQTKR